MSNDPSPLVQGEQIAYRSARALVGWLSDPESLQVLLGRNPGPTDDVEKLNRVVQTCRAVVRSRRPFIASCPITPAESQLAQEVVSRPEIATAFHGMKWRPAIVDLRSVLSFQKIINIEGMENRVDVGATPTLNELTEICIPRLQPGPPLGALQDADGKGFTVSSLNPNLRIVGAQLGDAMVSPDPSVAPVKMLGVTVVIGMGTSYVQVVQYRNRFFIRDGYHRTAGFLRHGIFEVPCIFIEAQTFAEVGAPAGAFSYEVLFGEQPPLLADFWDDAVARDVKQIAIRKVVRVRGEEFAVPR